MSVNLGKGQQVSPSKSDGSALTSVRMGLGWQAAPRKGFLARLTGGGTYTAQIMAKLYRAGGGRQLKAIGEPAAGRTFQDLLPVVAAHL
ncbi:hypothetical protein SAMN05216489_01635 [Streptomyces sp. 3213]|uniref:hypothetical protein n=1 Tax=Streptomyces sp. 3213.3 TaxID=1855348 RepID=UPI00089B0555|nr:hypothetical protein [Streptomyces sp. 3213.3]SEC79152.1 hypothetical protein SAMN05216489_01635 [Streptomyces sp. 3213] [Streptomyces sp. 3213.3]